MLLLKCMAFEIISLDKTMLLNLSAETIVYISSKLMVDMGDTFRKCLKGGGTNRGRGLTKSLGLIEGGG